MYVYNNKAFTLGFCIMLKEQSCQQKFCVSKAFGSLWCDSAGPVLWVCMITDLPTFAQDLIYRTLAR